MTNNECKTKLAEIRSKLSTIRNMLEELAEDANQVWIFAEGETSDDAMSLRENLRDLANDVGEMEPEPDEG